MEPSAESPAQRQARIRREKREKKILQGGSARLEKITSLSGQPTEPGILLTTNSGSRSCRSDLSLASLLIPNVSSQAPDPEEVDVSLHLYPSRRREPLQPSQIPTSSESNVRLLLRNTQAEAFGPSSAQDRPNQEPMLQMLQQMMSQVPTADSDGSGGEGDSGRFPPALASMLGGGGGMDMSRPPQTRAYIWKILHAFLSLLLGLYILSTHQFSGARADRLPSSPLNPKAGIFWVFATAELGLQGARYILQKGEGDEGLVGVVSGFLPQPWKGRVKLAGRYSGIWTTMVEDAMVVIWVLGAGAWWRGGIV